MKKPYIIAIDDDLSVLRAVERDLKAKFSSKYRVLAADSPQKAIDVVRQLTSRGDQVALFLVDQFKSSDYIAMLREVCPELANAEPGRLAVLCEDQDGNRARLCFADIRDHSSRIANVLAAIGVKPGDAVMIALPRITLWQAAYVGALKAGAIVIPCGAPLREKDLVYRTNHSGAVAIVAPVASADLIGDLRSRCPTLKHFLITGSPRSGWLGLRDSMAKASANFTKLGLKSGVDS